MYTFQCSTDGKSGEKNEQRWEGAMRRRLTSLVIFSAFLASLAWTPLIPPAAAQDAMSFAGKTVTMTIGFGAGERPDFYGRILGRSLVRFLPGHPTLLVLNKPGGGGVLLCCAGSCRCR